MRKPLLEAIEELLRATDGYFRWSRGQLMSESERHRLELARIKAQNTVADDMRSEVRK